MTAASGGGSAWTWVPSALGAPDEGVAFLRFDQPDSPVNLLSEATLSELALRLDEAATGEHRAVVVTSGKEESFIAGADVDAILAVDSVREGVRASALGQDVLRRLSTLGIPTVAAIHGACVGGGAELACWCDGRVASTSDRTRIGFPEVRLGIVPGFGGTQTLPGLVGLPQAIGLATTGRLLGPRAARRIGLVDSVVHVDHLLAEAARRARELERSPSRSRRRFVHLPGVRAAVTAVARRRVLARAGGRYPAPLEAVRLCRLALEVEPARGLAEEARALGRLLQSPTARGLLHVFDLTRTAKRGGSPPPPDSLVGVLGAGVMGAGIAGIAVAKGHRARVKDVQAEALGPAARTAARAIQRGLRQAWDRDVATRRALSRLSFTLRPEGFQRADLVVEAVVERLDVKHAVLREVEAAVGDACLLATNTSSLSVGELAACLEHPERFVGLHFFNPVPRMPLVEVVPGPATSEDTVRRAAGWAIALGKHPVVVADAPGFLVNRLLMPYLAEAFELLEGGAGVAEVDAAAEAFGMPMGPFRLLDEVGLDVARHVSETFAAAFPTRFRTSDVLARLVDGGRLGRKTRRGLYRHGRGAARPDHGLGRSRGRIRDGEIRDRLFLRMADEAVRCLAEGTCRSADDIDLATVMGMGFPPFRGGLWRHVKTEGPRELRARLEGLAERHGERFRPCAAWPEG